MTCEVNKSNGVVRIRGEMTIYAAAELKERLFTALGTATDACALDLAEVTELDLTGLQILLMAEKTCTARGSGFALRNPSEIVRDTLSLVQARKLLAALEPAP
jgi:anti-anti-sigma factor